MLMNYEKCDQVLFPLLQQQPGPIPPAKNLKKKSLWLDSGQKKNQL